MHKDIFEKKGVGPAFRRLSALLFTVPGGLAFLAVNMATFLILIPGFPLYWVVTGKDFANYDNDYLDPVALWGSPNKVWYDYECMPFSVVFNWIIGEEA